MSKTEEMGQTIESDHISELTEEEYDEKYLREDLRLKGFAYVDAKYLVPFFTRRVTKRVSYFTWFMSRPSFLEQLLKVYIY